jgi:REP-associated tyrosine transposase
MKPQRQISPAGTYFITSPTAEHKSFFQVTRNAELLVHVMREYESQGKFAIHAYVVMRDHMDVLITPSLETSLEKCMQFIKGGFSFRLKRELGFIGEVWQRGFTDHRIRDEHDLAIHVNYIVQNPVRRGLCSRPEDYPFSSAYLGG